jgi:ribosomal protein S18 acetylase RimI-like enzyme
VTSDGPTFRSLGADELGRFLDLDGPSYGPPGRDFLATAAGGHYRPEWTWVAEQDGRVVARAAWWAGADDEHPYALDWFDLDLNARPDLSGVGAELLREAHQTVWNEQGGIPDYHLFLPPDWRDRPDVVAAVDARTGAAEHAGLRLFVERLRLEWEASAGLPAPADQLRFAPVTDEATLLDLLEEINVGTLDAHAQRDLDREGARQAARIQLDDMLWMPAPQDWWRVASTPGGEPVGLVMPSRNYDSWVIAYLGVLPEHRGRGYVDDLLAEGTAVLAAQGADRIRADTDTTNIPMAAAFARAGYEVTQHRLVLTEPSRPG